MKIELYSFRLLKRKQSILSCWKSKES